MKYSLWLFPIFGYFSIENGDYGKMVVLHSAWNKKVNKYMSKHQIKGLYLNSALGWLGSKITFLNELQDLEYFKILDYEIDDISPIHHLHSIKCLEIDTMCKTPIDFCQFPLLEECFLNWRDGSDSIFDRLSLKTLFINEYPYKDANPLSSLKNLQSLTLANSKISNIKNLEKLSDLKNLELRNVHKLESLDGVENLVGLEEIRINGSKKLENINQVQKLINLRTLMICNVGAIESIKPIEQLTNLEVVLFFEDTNILDGDMSPLKNLPSLKKVAFKNRRHYSHTREEIMQAIKV